MARCVPIDIRDGGIRRTEDCLLGDQGSVELAIVDAPENNGCLIALTRMSKAQAEGRAVGDFFHEEVVSEGKAFS